MTLPSPRPGNWTLLSFLAVLAKYFEIKHSSTYPVVFEGVVYCTVHIQWMFFCWGIFYSVIKRAPVHSGTGFLGVVALKCYLLDWSLFHAGQEKNHARITIAEPHSM